jgi:hypothetical protein
MDSVNDVDLRGEENISIRVVATINLEIQNVESSS